ncbi:unnamed protein product [Symbiodinium sp. CCMP2592]|nr:unnamed protein product [Symbiodinium sp. CCMP2592]
MHSGRFEGPRNVVAPAQQRVLDRVHELVVKAGDLGDLRHPLSQEAALRELLHGRSDYHSPTDPIALAPFKQELVSLPESLHCAPTAVSLLGGSDRLYLEEEGRMLRESPPEHIAIRPYWDPSLRYNRRTYRGFMRRLRDLGYLEFTRAPLEEAGIFFVLKSDRKHLRMIVDARRANAVFREPPGVDLCSAEGFSRIEVEDLADCRGLADGFPGEGVFPDDWGLYVGLSDVKDAFHRMKQPRWLSRYFCFLPLTAGELGLTGDELEGSRLRSHDVVYPMPGSLCMGFSWSLYFCQRINENQLREVFGPDRTRLISDRGPPAVFTRGSPAAMRQYVYVDNLGVISSDRQQVENALDQVTEHFTAKELLLHPGEVHRTRIKSLGVELNGTTLTTRVSAERLHRVRQGIRALLSRKRASGRTLQIVIGHATYCALANRRVMPIFHTVYKYIEKFGDKVGVLWDTVCAELRAFSGLMVFLESRWDRPWSSKVMCSDASEEGYGVVSSWWSPREVAAHGRVPERGRFRRSGGHNARESALTSAGFVKDELTGQWLAGEVDSQDYLSQAGWEIDDQFPEIPGGLLRKEAWTPEVVGAWKRPDNIVRLEARALIIALQRVCRDIGGSSIRQLCLVDSMSVALCMDRCRSRDFRLLCLVRKFCSLCLAHDVTVTIRWVPSELNNADEGSRISSAVASKVLTAQLGNHASEGLAKASFISAIPAEPRRATEETQDLGAGSGGASNRAPEKASANSAGLVPEAAYQHKSGTAYSRGRESADSDATSSTSEPLHVKKGSRLLARRSRRRTRQYVNEIMEAQSQGLSLLEKKAVGAKAEQYYISEVDKFRAFVNHKRGSLATPPEVDKYLTAYMNDLFLQGHPAHRGDKLMAGWMHCHPEFGRCGSKRLPRAWRSLKGWRRLSPGQSRKAFPLAVWAAIACELVSRGFLRMAIFTMVALSSYARPSSLLACLVWQLVAPTPQVTKYWSLLLDVEEKGKPSKTGLYDNSVLLDSSYLQPWGPVLFKELAKGRKDSNLWDFTYGELSSAINAVTKALGLEITLYQARHSGPSIDRAQDIRSQLEVQRRGQWMSHKSVIRYERGARLASNFQSLPYRLQQHCLLAERLLGDVMLGRRRNLKGCYVMDLFAGQGVVASACRRLGFRAKEWELERGIEYDLTRSSVVRHVLAEIRSGRVLAVMMAPPCTSFSVGKDRLRALRTSERPWGVPRYLLTEEDWQKVQKGNACFRAVGRIAHLCYRLHIPFFIENPASSKCWTCIAFNTDVVHQVSGFFFDGAVPSLYSCDLRGYQYGYGEGSESLAEDLPPGSWQDVTTANTDEKQRGRSDRWDDDGARIPLRTTASEKVTAEQKSLADAVEAVEELFDEGDSTTTTGADSIEVQGPGIVSRIFEDWELEKTEAASELSGSDRDKIAANVHEQMEDKAALPGAALQGEDIGSRFVLSAWGLFARLQSRWLAPMGPGSVSLSVVLSAVERNQKSMFEMSDSERISLMPDFSMATKQVDGANSSNATQTDLLWSHEHKECLEPENIWTPLSMPDQSRTDEPDHISCRARCLAVRGCAHWSYYLGAGSCYLQNSSATKESGKGAVSGIPGCRDKDPSIHLGMNAGGQSCYHLSGSFIPLDMPEQKRTKEASYDLCQARCLETHGCSKFTYFIMDQGCHLQENSSHLVFLPGTIAGAASCPAEDKAKFDAYLKQLPMMRALESSEPPCEDSWVSFIPFDLPGDLDHPGDLAKDKEVKCEALYDHSDSPHICKHSSQVRVRCPKLCGECGIEKDAGGCVDLQADEHPLFLLDNHTLGCASVGYACNHDEEVTQKCKYTCGKCTTTTTTVAKPEVDHLAKAHDQGGQGLWSVNGFGVPPGADLGVTVAG